MRISDWSSDVCSSDLSGVSLTGSYTPASGGGGGGGGGGGYYDGIVASSAGALRSALHNLIDDHTKIPYTASTTDTWDALKLADQDPLDSGRIRSEEHTSELQSLMRISYAVFC